MKLVRGERLVFCVEFVNFFLLFHYLSYGVAVIQWITSCHKNRMTTRVRTLWRADVTFLTTSVSTMRLLAEMLIL